MNQPKFKFGDKLKTDRGAKFTVGVVRIFDEKYQYGSGLELARMHSEEDCRLDEEPQKKKLYAYKNRGEIKFSEHGNYKTHDFDGVIFEEAPEYDIEYPSREEA